MRSTYLKQLNQPRIHKINLLFMGADQVRDKGNSRLWQSL